MQVCAPSAALAAPGASRAATGVRKPPLRTTRAQASAAPPPRSKPRVYFSAEEYRHPLDSENTRLLQLLPGIAAAVKAFSPVAEETLFLEHTGASLLVGPQQLPHLHARLLQAAAVLGVDAPALYVRQAPSPNAYTLAINGRKPIVIVHTALLELLDDDEVQAVLAHGTRERPPAARSSNVPPTPRRFRRRAELGHLACDHGVWLTLANIFTLSAGALPGAYRSVPLASHLAHVTSRRSHPAGVPRWLVDSLEDGLLRWLRAAELTCDRAALLVVRDPAVVVRVLMKLAGGSPKTAPLLNVDAFLAQARAYDDASQQSLLSWYLSNAQTRALSHPLPVARAREVDRWAGSAQYRSLLLRLPPVVAGAAQPGVGAGAVGALPQV